MADVDMDSIARQIQTERPKVPLNAPTPIVRAHLDFDKAFGDLPKRFLRAARVLADRHDCREEWNEVERTHDALEAEGKLPS